MKPTKPAFYMIVWRTENRDWEPLDYWRDPKVDDENCYQLESSAKEALYQYSKLWTNWVDDKGRVHPVQMAVASVNVIP